jgi:hypothetical protein
MASLVVMNKHQNDTHHDEDELCALNMIKKTLRAIVNTIRRVYVITKSKFKTIYNMPSLTFASQLQLYNLK